jgi:putative oxidoreductase
MSFETVGRRVRGLHSSWRTVDVAALVLRGVLGYVFVAHGAQKLFGWFGGGGLDGTTKFFTFLKVPSPHFFAAVAGVTEFVGGILLIAGFLTVLTSLALIVDMALAIALFNIDHGFFVESPNGGWELNFTVIGLLAALTLIGAGAVSIDRAIGLARRAEEATDPYPAGVDVRTPHDVRNSRTVS